jgi:hypothetical protein
VVRPAFLGARKKDFFFEKRSKKRCACAVTNWRLGAQLTRNPTDKSFLVLFFKKEHLSFCDFDRAR